jgi:hypothetical protein
VTLREYTTSPGIEAQRNRINQYPLLGIGLAHLTHQAKQGLIVENFPAKNVATYGATLTIAGKRVKLAACFEAADSGSARLITLALTDETAGQLFICGEVLARPAFTKARTQFANQDPPSAAMVEFVVEKIDAQLPLRAPLSGREASFSFFVDEHTKNKDEESCRLIATVTLDLKGDMTGLKIELDPVKARGPSPPLVWINTAPARPVTSTLQRSLMGMHVDAVAPASQGEEQDVDWPTASTSAGHVQPMAAVAGPSGIGSQHHLGASTSAIPAAATPANLPAAHLKGIYYNITAVFHKQSFDLLAKRKPKERGESFQAVGCTEFTHANAISEMCDARQGEYMDLGIYAYRNLVFGDHIVNVYRRVDPSGCVRDFRLLKIEPGATQQENPKFETAILESMQTSYDLGEGWRTINGPDSLGNSPLPPPSYPLAKNLPRMKKEYRKDFERLGFTIPADLVGLVHRCEAAVDKVEGVNIVPLTNKVARPFLLAWITRGNLTVGLLAQQENEDERRLKKRAKTFRIKSAGQANYAAMFQI